MSKDGHEHQMNNTGVKSQHDSFTPTTIATSSATPSLAGETTYPPKPQAAHPPSPPAQPGSPLDHTERDGRAGEIHHHHGEGEEEDNASTSSYTTAQAAAGPPRPPSSASQAMDHRSSVTASDGVRSSQRGDVDEDDDSEHEGDDSDTTTSTTAHSPPSTPTSVVTPALQVRLSLSRRLWTGLAQMRGRSRFMLAFQGCLTLACVAAYTTMLVLSDNKNEQCQKPLKTYLILIIVKISLSYPVSFYLALAPPSRPRRGEADTPEARERREARRVMGSPVLDARLRTVADLISIFSLVWFVLGNLWVYSGLRCKMTAPHLWWASLATLLLAYARLAEIALIVLAVVFFLPVVILGLRMFGGLEKKHEIGPLSKDQIASLPVVLYIPAKDEQESAGTVDQSTAATSTQEKLPDSQTPPSQQKPSEPSRIEFSQEESAKPPTPPRRRTQWLRLLFKRNRKGDNADTKEVDAASSGPGADYVKTVHPLKPLPDNLSSCPICLSDYEAPPLRSEAASLSCEELKTKLKDLELLNLLPCGHTLHKDCLEPWLQTSGRCPICQKAVFPEQSETKGKRRRGRTTTAAQQGSGTNQVAASPHSTRSTGQETV